MISNFSCLDAELSLKIYVFLANHHKSILDLSINYIVL